MIVLIVGLIAVALVGTALALAAGSIARSKVVGVLVWLTATTTLAFVPIAIAVGGEGSPAMASHSQLDADRAMTQQMAVVVGPGMDAQMASYDMLGRSANPEYVAALEQHTAQFDQSAGLRP